MMVNYTDSTTRAAHTLLAERYRQTPTQRGNTLVVRGYTAEVAEQVLLPVLQSTAAANTRIGPVSRTA